jgi:hypothetical protein
MCFEPGPIFGGTEALGPIFIFCGPRLVLGGTEGVSSCFNILRARTRFRRYRGRQAPFSCFAVPDSFSAVPTASGPVFMFCAPAHVFSGTDGVGSCFRIRSVMIIRQGVILRL